MVKAMIETKPSLQKFGNQNRLIVVPRIANQNPNGNGNVVAAQAEGNAIRNNGNQIRCYNCRELGHLARKCTVRPRRRDAACLQTHLLIAQKEEVRIQLQAEEFDLMVAAADLDEIEKVNANFILMASLQQARHRVLRLIKLPSMIQTDQLSAKQSEGTVDQHSATVEETRAYHESLFHSLATKVEKVNLVNRKMKETNVELTIELARYKNQEKCFEISQEKYDKIESSGKQITALNEEISNLNKQLSKEKATVSSLQEEKKRLKSDFKIRKDEFLDKQIQLENQIKELNNILVKTEDESLAKHKALELEIERLLRAVVSQDIMSIVQSNFVVDTSNLQTELERTKERFENCIIKRENEYAKLWNDWYKKCEECKYDKISYDKAYNGMQQKIERLQAQLGDQKGKSKDTPCVSNTLDLLPQKLKNENVELEFQIRNYEKENAHLKFLNKRTPPKGLLKIDESHALSKPVTSNSVPIPQESKVVKNDKVIASGMFRIDPSKTSRENKFVPINKVRASIRTKPITVSQPHVNTKKDVISDSNSFSSTGVNITAKTRRPRPRSSTKNDRVLFASKSSCIMNEEVEVEEHHRNLLLSKNKKHMSSECNNVKPAIWNAKTKVVCAMCKQCLITANHDVCVLKNLKLLINFVWKFLGTVRFGNDHVAAILGFVNLQWGNILITRVYFVEGLGHNMFSVRQFYDSDLEVAFRRNTCFVRNLEGVDLLKGNRTTNLYTINLHEMASASSICLMTCATSTKSWLWHQRLSHLNFDTINDLAKNDLVTAKVIATACYTQNRSIIHRRFNKMPYELINGRKPDISFLRVFGALCYPKNDREDIGKLGAKGDIGFFIGYSADSCAYRVYNRRTKKIMEKMNVTFDELSAMAFEQRSLKPGLQGMTSGQISLGLDLTYAPSTITTQKPTECELDLLFEAMYDGFIGGQPSAATRTAPAAQAPQVLQTPTASTTAADTAPTPTNSSSQATNIPNTSHDVDELATQQQHVQQQENQAPLQPETVADNVPNAMFNGNTFVNPFATPSTSAAESSYSQYVDPSNMHTFYQPYPHEYQWTKDHPLEQVIGEPSRPVLTMNQL
ncbi:retrovirus-related pol polyprotein from transposon TNT 1-94 [Tanacetum coccineum]